MQLSIMMPFSFKPLREIGMGMGKSLVAARILKSYLKKVCQTSRNSRPHGYRCNMRCHYCIYWKWKCEEMSTKEIGKMMREASKLGIANYGDRR